MNERRLLEILSRVSEVRILVIGDLFLDKYLILDKELTEISLETGLEAYQAVDVKLLPGAAGTVAKDLRAIGASVSILTIIGEDGEGYEVVGALKTLGMDMKHMIVDPSHFTPTYIKPMLREKKESPRELNRIDIKNREAVPSALEERIIASLRMIVQQVDGVAISDQVEEHNCGIITDRIREELSQLALAYPRKVFIADSRARIGLFRNVICKPNYREAVIALGETPEERPNLTALRHWGQELRRMSGKPVFITIADQGILVFPQEEEMIHVPAIPVPAPIDVVGAGDSVMSGLLATLCVGASPEEAAFIACLMASVTIKQLETTGTAAPEQVLAQFRIWESQKADSSLR